MRYLDIVDGLWKTELARTIQERAAMNSEGYVPSSLDVLHGLNVLLPHRVVTSVYVAICLHSRHVNAASFVFNFEVYWYL
jgi:hypothetical protein